MRFDWDPHKDALNRQKHGLGFTDAVALFTSGADYLEIFDETHSDDEDRFIAVGLIDRGVIVVIWTEQPANTIRIISARPATQHEIESFRQHMEDPS
ncbi:BrnT family toxin [Paraliomyxa miuraensis]|uniref:BrnT family toxin n=1 Tax=Paraliomyxa miuraensis TaxID=376150 RepID=UPI002258D8AB|nr:BrnT family toxin [Paraliomyxa miuraensis]MCX4247941.1 BrnT family toxin [Paraliomyxa miuraensis]